MLNISKERLLLLAGTPLSYASIWLLARLCGLELELKGILTASPVIALLTGALSIFATRLNMHTLRALVECFGCGFLLTVPLVIATYVAMRANFELADARLSQWDIWLGMDWFSIIRWLDDHALFAEIFNQAYRTLSYQLLLCPLVLIFAKKSTRAYQMISAYALLCFIASAISMFWPAVGTYVFYRFDPTTLRNIDTTYGYHFLQQFHAVREDPNFIWRIEESAGILTFPSVHAAVAILCAWAMWDVRLLRYPALILNITMAISAVPAANHYVVDVIAGCLVGFCAIVLVVLLTKSHKRSVAKEIDRAAIPDHGLENA